MKFLSARLLVERTANIEKRCIYDVMKKSASGDTARDGMSRAFAICRSSMQKAGNYKTGTADLTKSGSKKNKSSYSRQANKRKIGGFKRMVVKARDSK